MPGPLTARAAALQGRVGARGAPLVIAAAAFSVQGGAALATTMFARGGPLGAALLRVGFAAVVLALLAGRRLRRPDRTLVVFGVALAAMNASFYEALDRVPLGVAVTAEFLGPLAVAIAGSRRRRDLVWVVLAGAGVALLGSPTVDVDALGLGLGFAVLAGAFWSVYIVLGRRIATTGDVVGGLGTAMLVGAVALLPFGLIGGGSGLGEGAVLWRGLVVALLSSVVPYVLELAALQLIRAATFGILMSLEPAVAALCGAVFIGQGVGGIEIVAIGCVVVASLGASLQATRDQSLPQLEI